MSEVFGTSYAYICRFPIPPYTAPGVVVWEVWVTRFSLKLTADGKLLESWAHQFLKQFCCWCLVGGVPHSTAYYLLGLHLSESLDDFKIQNFQIVVHSHFSISTSNIATKPGRMWMILMISTSKPPHQTAQATIESAAFRAFHRVTLDDERCSGGNKWGNKTTVEETGMYIV